MDSKNQTQKREIKFRAWSEENKEMYYRDFDDYVVPENTPLYYSGLNGHGELFAGIYLENGDYEDLVLMQFTGLKDKNGKEIYEGDILKFYNKLIEPVKFSNGAFTVFDEPLGFEENCGKFMPFDTEEWCEIIGNIHQNPELLK